MEDTLMEEIVIIIGPKCLVGGGGPSRPTFRIKTSNHRFCHGFYWGEKSKLRWADN